MLSDVATVTHNDWVILSYFIANMQVRSPSYHEMLRITFREMTDDINSLVQRMKDSYQKAKTEGKEFRLPSTFPGEHSYSIEELNKSMEELEGKDGHLRIAEELYKSIKEIASYVQKMSLHIMEAPGALFFITTDTPLVLYSLSSGTPVGAGWANRDAMCMIPIHPKYYFILAYRGAPAIYRNTITPADVRLLNINLMKYAYREVYSKYPYDISLDWMFERGVWRTVK